MADSSRTIEIIFAGVDNLSGSLIDMGGKVDSFGQGLKDIGQPLSDAATAVLALEIAMSAMAVGGLVLATTKAGEFKTGMAEVNTLLGISETKFSGLEQDLLAYSTNSTAPLSDLQSALYSMISLGVDYSESISALTKVEKLSVAAKADMNVTTETLVGTMNAYGAKISESSTYSDAFFTIIKVGKTTLPELATSIASVTGIASTANIPFKTLGSAIAAITAAGTPTSEAMTQIKAAISALVAPTEATSKAAKAYGVDIGQAAIDSKGFEGVLKELYTATGGSLAKMQAIIPSIEGVQAAVTLGADKAGIFAKALADMGTNTGATEIAFDKMSKNLSLSLQTMTNSFDAMFIKLGLSLGGSSSEIVKGFAGLWQSIGTSIDAGSFDTLIEYINGIFKSISDNLGKVSANLPEALKDFDFTDIINSFNGLGSAIGTAFGDIDITSVEGLKKAIGLVSDSIVKLNGVAAGIITVLAPMVVSIGELAVKFSALDSSTIEIAGKILGIGTAITAVGTVVSSGSAILTGLGTLGVLLSPPGLIAAGLTSIAGLVYGMRDAFKDYSKEDPATEMERLSKSLNELDSQDIEVLLDVDSKTAQEAIDLMGQIPTDVRAEIAAKLNDGDVEGAKKQLAAALEDVGDVPITILTDDEAATVELDSFFKDLDTYDKNLSIVMALDGNGDVVNDVETVKTTLENLPEKTNIAIALETGDYQEVNGIIDTLSEEQQLKISADINDGSFDTINDYVGILSKDQLLAIKAAVDDGSFKPVNDFMSSLDADQQVKILADIDAGDFESAQKIINETLDERSVIIAIDDPSLKDVKTTFETVGKREDGSPIIVEIPVETSGVDKAKKDIEAIPTEKMLEMRLQGDIDKELKSIETKAETVQTAMEWSAKVDIANAEAAAQRVSSAFEAAGVSVTALAGSTSDMFGDLLSGWGELDTADRSSFFDIMEGQQKKQNELVDAQIKLTEAEQKYLEAKTEQMNNGDGQIKIDGTGLSPALEMVMWEILGMVQIRATEEQADFLLGV